MHLIDCLFLIGMSLLGQLLSILLKVRKYLELKNFDWVYWRHRNLPEYFLSIIISGLLIIPLCLSDFAFLEFLGIPGAWSHPLACFIIGFSLDLFINKFAKIANRK